MKASVAIKLLQDLMDSYGDLNINFTGEKLAPDSASEVIDIKFWDETLLEFQGAFVIQNYK